MSESHSKPLLTFVVVSYNHEAFIREAVEGALAQTYSPLEIILSDDCSSDRTFDIMSELAAAYRGPHKIILNRNPVRRSIGGHFNKVLELAHGELIVGSGGDDISLPHRTQTIYETWENSGRKATSIHSNFIQIDDLGHPIQQVINEKSQWEATPIVQQDTPPLDYVKTLEPIVFGCTHAFARHIMDRFGPMPAEIIHEDNIITLRSILAGRVVRINQPLIKYRVHSNNAFIRRKSGRLDLKVLTHEEDSVRRGFRNRETMYGAFVTDLETAHRQQLIGQAEYEPAAALATRLRRQFALRCEFLEKGPVRQWQIISELKKDGLKNGDIKFLAIRLIPKSILLRYRLLCSRLTPTKA